MVRKLMECIPNFSEGVRLEVIDAIAAEIEAVADVKLLDRSSDPDHNRSVMTFVGAPEAIVKAAFAAIAKAAQLIDLDQHQGQHPRIGAADVVPFVPLQHMTLDECVVFARALGERVGRELNIPVYLYEAAASRPNRVALENIRRGNYEGLKTAIQTEPDRAPDFGPSQLGSSGATVIGARMPLIAYNVYLTTDDVEIARNIAIAIRHSSGGLRYVKALGLLVNGRAQVSMNLTDFTQTPIARVVEMIRREAARYGVGIHHAELIGLIPQAALIDAARWYLQLDQFSPDQILESRLNEALNNDAIHFNGHDP
jgi:glutamate formiminotransferase / formiminotetrahydrofolate cyclodeaminase